jgi:nucleotide-binding universal stress UspA family protein
MSLTDRRSPYPPKKQEQDRMTQRLIVPVDGSPAAWHTVDIAITLAERLSARVHVLEVAFAPADVNAARARLEHGAAERQRQGAPIDVEVRLSGDSVASAIEELVLANPGSVVVMASHGRGRSAALVGSVAEDILHRIFGPIILVGPKVGARQFDGPIVVSVDGSDESEAALPLSAAWAIELGVAPWIVHVAHPEDRVAQDSGVVDSGYPARLARELTALSHHQVEFEELHDAHPGRAVPDFADSLNASLIVAASHGRTGMRRLTMGSVTSEFVRHSTCPVLVVRLPLPAPDRRDASAMRLAT